MDLHLNTVSIESGIVVPEMSVSGIPELAISASSSYRAMFIIKLYYASLIQYSLNCICSSDHGSAFKYSIN